MEKPKIDLILTTILTNLIGQFTRSSLWIIMKSVKSWHINCCLKLINPNLTACHHVIMLIGFCPFCRSLLRLNATPAFVKHIMPYKNRFGPMDKKPAYCMRSPHLHMRTIFSTMRVKFLTLSRRPFQRIYSSKALLKSVYNEKTVEFSGFTLVELIAVIGIISILSGLAIPSYRNYIHQAKCMKAVADIRTLDKDIMSYKIYTGELPDNLSDINWGNLKDPWGSPYQYLNFKNIKGKGKMRKDHFLVPLNTDYDLCSMGKDGKSNTPLSAAASRDDIIRANDGMYVGKAYLY